MQSKLLIIQQAFGLGDIIWGQTIANDFIKEGYKVLWPVSANTEGLNRAYPKVTFVPDTFMPQQFNNGGAILGFDYLNKSFYEQDGIRFLPMRYSENLMGKQYRFHMESKYSFLGKDWRRWKEHAMPVRDKQKEKDLMQAIGIKKGQPYTLLQMNFGSGNVHQINQINVEMNHGLKHVILDFVPGYSLFDWCGIIENACFIHAVSSSSLYLFELLDLQAEQVHLYPRKPHEQNFDYVQFLFTKNYKLHE